MSWNRSFGTNVATNAKQITLKNKRVLIVALFVGLTLIVLGLIGWLLYTAKQTVETTAPKESKPKKIASAKPANPVVPKPVQKVDPLDSPKFKGLPKDRIRRTAKGDYIYLPRRGEERFPGERAQALALIGGTNGTAAVDNRPREDPDHPWMFHNSIQSDLVQFCRPGEFAVPINPNISDEAAWDAIKAPIDFHENDTDTQLEEKQMVKDMLSDLKAYMEQGGHARDYFSQLYERQDAEAEIMLKTRQDVYSILNRGDIDGAREALDVYNQYRKQKGLPEMRVRKLNGPERTEIHK